MDFSITTDAYDYNAPIAPRLDAFKAAGFRHIHWCERWAEDYMYAPDEIAAIVQAFRDRGMVLMDTHNAHCDTALIDDPNPAVRDGGMRLLRNRMALTKTLGGDVVVVHPPKGNENPDARFRIFADALREIEPECRAAGMRIAVENMASLRGAHAFDLDPLFDRFAPDFLGFCYDSGHANMAGLPELIERYGARLIALHLHDNRGSNDDHALPGDGTVNWPYIVGVLRRLNYSRPVNLEVGLKSRPGMAPAEFVREARKRITARFSA